MNVPVIRRVAVLGAGTMGAQIAAHFANAGVPALLLDVTPEAAVAGLARARALKPSPFFTAEVAALVTTGSFDRDLDRLRDADWIIEAITEQLEAKRTLLRRVERVRRPGTLVSSNTSGIPIHLLAEGLGDDMRGRFAGTHFFNPPRYVTLLELIPTVFTSPDTIEAISSFADRRLGRGVVPAKDTPNFIGNRIVLFEALRVIEQVASGAYTIEEADALTGPLLGRPKSATCRTLDVAGLDIVATVVRNLYERLPAPERDHFHVPALLEGLVERGWLGEKAGRGFYERERSAGGSIIRPLDPASFTYRTPRPPSLPELEGVRRLATPADRVRALLDGHHRSGEFVRATVLPSLMYAAAVAPEIAHSIDDVDRVLRWGFAWDAGPFELLDDIGHDLVGRVWRESGGEVPSLLAGSAARSSGRFRPGRVPPANAEFEILRSARERSGAIWSNAGASLIDLGDGVVCLEFHSKMNTIGPETIDAMSEALDRAEAGHTALVIGNEGQHFSAGANLKVLMTAAEAGDWGAVDGMVQTFQRALQALRYARVPVVVATAGLTLGGGCEIALHATRVQAAAESYIGLAECSIGVIPAGGGTTAMLRRAGEAYMQPPAFQAAVRRAFETMGMARVSSSAADARALGYLTCHDGITMNRHRLLDDARKVAVELSRQGYQPPIPRPIAVGGRAHKAALELGVHLMHRARRISDYDAVIGRVLANVLSGGDLPHATTVHEQHVLDLEREGFLSLCGDARTRARIRHTLETGKPLRN